MADLDLYAVRERWTREQAWAPAYVAEEMRAAYALGREYTEDAALAGARLAQLEPDDPAWEQAAAQLERSQWLAALNLERARQLDEIHHARGGWYDSTEDARVADGLAHAELERRGLPPQRELDRGEQLELFDPADLDVDQHAQPGLEVDVRADVESTVEATVDPVLEAQPAHEADVVAQAREPDEVDVERALEDAQAEVTRSVERGAADARQVEVHLEDGIERDGVELDDVELEQQNDAGLTPEPVAAAEPERTLPEAGQLETVHREVEQPGVEPPEVEQLALLEVEPDIADEVGVQPLRTPEADPAVEQARAAAAAAERERQEQARVTLAEARRQAEAANAQQQAREAAAATTAALEQAMQDLRAAMAAAEAAERARVEDAERQEQLIRWHEQDRADELDRGLDDGPGLGMG
jgi:hypothetical protein